jgi:hypothetical protein
MSAGDITAPGHHLPDWLLATAKGRREEGKDIGLRCNTRDELFSRAIEKQQTVIDEKLFLEAFSRQEATRIAKKDRHQ